jgi:CRISPR-associated exonuclease Cas4
MSDAGDERLNEPVNVSALNQYAYCPRRCALIYLEGEFADNIHTARGNAEHERVDSTAHATGKDGARTEYALPIWSERIGLIGKCDAVEFWPDGTIFPVEYKHGKRRAWINDDLQLAAQAMCLEEMLGTPVREGAIFHASSRRRREVRLTDVLRRQVEDTVSAIRQILAAERLPPVTTEERRCRECSMREICEPEMGRAAVKIAEARRQLFEPDR